MSAVCFKVNLHQTLVHSNSSLFSVKYCILCLFHCKVKWSAVFCDDSTWVHQSVSGWQLRQRRDSYLCTNVYILSVGTLTALHYNYVVGGGLIKKT